MHVEQGSNLAHRKKLRSLRQAIIDVDPAGTIDFDSSVTTIVLTTGELSITKDVTINGPGAGSLTIDGNGISRVFRITGVTASISGLTLTNGGAVPVACYSIRAR